MATSPVLDIGELVQQDMVVKGLHLVTFVYLLYDIFENLDEEVKFVWFSNGIVGNLLYFATRYLSLVDMTVMAVYLFRPNLDPHTCTVLNRISTYFIVSGIIIAEIILVIRTWVIWHRSRVVLAYLVAVELALTIAGVVNVHTSLNELHYGPSLLPTLIPCFPSTLGFRVYIDFASVLFMDLNILLFTLRRAFSQLRGNRSNLVRTLYRDGFLYFFFLCVISLANLVLYAALLDTSYYFVLLEPQRVLHSTLSARLIRNVKKVAVGDTKFHSAFVTSRLGGLEFDVNATASDTLNTLDSDATELQDLSVDERRCQRAVRVPDSIHASMA